MGARPPKTPGANTDERTLRQIIALTGASVRQLATELEKLATAALPGGHVTMEMVDALVGRSRELSNFELTDSLSRATGDARSKRSRSSSTTARSRSC